MEATTTETGEVKDIQEIGITITAQNLNPATLNVDFLKSSGVVPGDWQLAKQPVLSAARSQLSFQNGLNIVAQPRTITFAEALRIDGSGQSNAATLSAPTVAGKYVESLPHASYQGLSIAPGILVNFPTPERSPREFLVETLLAPGPWRDIGKAPAQASVNFVYLLERCQLSVSLNEVRLRPKDRKEAIPAILFAGTFGYGVANVAEGERVAYIKSRLQAWATDLDEFQDIVHQKFLGGSTNGSIGTADPIIPSGAVLAS